MAGLQADAIGIIRYAVACCSECFNTYYLTAFVWNWLVVTSLIARLER